MSGGTIYISTNPSNNVPIGIAGQGITIGPLLPLLYATPVVSGGGFMTTETGDHLVLESDITSHILTES
jgi:hypothetical protein